MEIVLPQSKTYLPGPGQCIYCHPDPLTDPTLRREHIIPRKLGGQLILHNASCTYCMATINSEIETPTLTQFWIDPRTHLGMPTSHPRESLRYGTYTGAADEFPPQIPDDFAWQDLPVADHPFVFVSPIFAMPTLLGGPDLGEQFSMAGIAAYGAERAGSLPKIDGKTSAIFQPFDPSVICRSIAKIAHGAAVAELGFEAFTPFLPPVILGKEKAVSRFIGTEDRSRPLRTTSHEITLLLRNGFLVARVHLFANLTRKAYLAVVGTPGLELAKWHSSATIVLSAPPQ